jgi:hypothetical protein
MKALTWVDIFRRTRSRLPNPNSMHICHSVPLYLRKNSAQTWGTYNWLTDHLPWVVTIAAPLQELYHSNSEIALGHPSNAFDALRQKITWSWIFRGHRSALLRVGFKYGVGRKRMILTNRSHWKVNAIVSCLTLLDSSKVLFAHHGIAIPDEVTPAQILRLVNARIIELGCQTWELMAGDRIEPPRYNPGFCRTR